MKYKLVNKDIRENYLKELLKERGVTDLDSFFEPREDLLQSPLFLENISEGAKLFLDTLENKDSNILTIVDSDVDGYTSSAIIYSYTKLLYPDCNFDYILHDAKQHGLSDLTDLIMNMDKHYDLIIQPDSGTNDFEFHKKLEELNTKVLVLDHHEKDENVDINDNVVLINNQTSKEYKNKNLSGSGITWQFCRYIDSIKRTNYSTQFIDLAALGCVSDMMSSVELENRFLFTAGFKNITNDFFKTLVEKQSYSMKGEVNPITISFYIAPLLNGMIRVGSQEEKAMTFEAFIHPDLYVTCNKRGSKGEQEKCCIEAARVCVNARAKQNRQLDKVIEQLDFKIKKNELVDNKILFIKLEEEDFPSELNGLVAMKLSKKYQMPTMVGRLNEQGFDRGSIRGLSNSALVDFKGFLQESNLFEYVQGHPNAAGYSLKDSNLIKLHNYANNRLADFNFNENSYDVNFIREASDMDLAPLILDLSNGKGCWGQKNSEPLLYVGSILVDKADIQIMGKKNDTIKIEKFGICYMKFRATKLIEEIQNTKTSPLNFDIIGTPNLNEWNGYKTPQVFILDYDLTEDRFSF